MTATTATRTKPRFIYLLTVAQRRVQSAIHGSGDDKMTGKTAARAGLLFALHPSGAGTPMAALGADLDMGPSTLSGLVDRMARDNLVRRQPDPDDGRAWLIALTDAGKTARTEAARATRQLNDRLAEGFSDAELAIVVRWLEAARSKFPPKNA